MNNYHNSPDFFVISDNDVALLYLVKLLNKSQGLYTSNITSIFSTYKKSYSIYKNIISNTLKSIDEPLASLSRNEGAALRNDIFNIESDFNRCVYGIFISSLMKDVLNDDDDDNNESISNCAFKFLSDSRDIDLTFRNLINSLLNSTDKGDNCRSKFKGVSILSSIDDTEFLSGLYPDAKFIRLNFDIHEDQSKIANYPVFNGEIANRVDHILLVKCSELVSCPDKCIYKIYEFIKNNAQSLTGEENSGEIKNKSIPSIDDCSFKSDSKSSIYLNDGAHSDSNVFKDPDFFISGPPRCGTSLLTVLLNDHQSISVAQDTGVYTEFVEAATWVYQVIKHRFNINSHYIEIPIIKEGFGKIIRDNSIDFNSKEDNLIFNLYFTCIVRFLAVDFFIPDPRKDRGTGMRYLNHINFQYALRKIRDLKLPFRSLLNFIVNSIIDGEGEEGALRGEKTPTNTMHPSFMRSLYPNAKFINVIRSPLGFVGSRHQRLDVSMEDHCDFYRSIMENLIENDGRTMTVKYEDLIENPDLTINRVHRFLGVMETGLSDELDPGAYPKYVGSKVDVNRNKQNIDYLTSEMKGEIKYHLKDLIDSYYPELNCISPDLI